MIIPWQQLEDQTLINIIDSFILREGTDYGAREFSLVEKRNSILTKLRNDTAVIVWSELHESIDIKDKMEFLKQR